MSKAARPLLFLCIVFLIAVFFLQGGPEYFTLEFFQSQRQAIDSYVEEFPLQSLSLFFVVYVMVTALSLPGAAIMTLAAGAIFGLWLGLLVVSFASSIGATLAFLVSRSLLRDWVQQRFAKQLASINKGFEEEGNFYLFGLRLVPAFPFFLINLLMGITSMRVWNFYWVSQVGMLAGTFVYVNAGTQLGELQSLQGILSAEIIVAFCLLGVFPLLAKRLLSYFRSQSILKNFTKPKKFDRNLIVVGAGAAGLVSSYIAATVRAKVSLIEKHKMGGDCLNTGCVPSKALLRSAKIASYARRGEEFGIKVKDVEVDFAAVMERVQKAITQIEPHDSVERYTDLGVECIQGSARFISPWEVTVNGKVLSARNFIVATGGRPAVPDIENLDTVDYYTSDTIWEIREKPQKLLVMGGGPIACELSQAFRRLDVSVTMVQRNQRLLPKEDEEVSAYVNEKFASGGIEVLCQHTARKIETVAGKHYLVCDHKGQEVRCEFDTLLIAVGRSANTRGFGLEELGVQLSENGTIAVNEYMQSNVPTLYACGDVAGPYQFTHVAAHQAWYASVNSLFGMFKRFKVDYSVIPWCTFTDPEIARVGLNELEAKAQSIEYEVTRYDLDDLDRAIADSETAGFVKVLTEPRKDKILGVTIVGYHAGELITEFIQAKKFNLGLNKILGTIHIYPTLAEANKYAAGEWKKARKPEGLLNWVEKFHHWKTGQ